MSTKKEFELVKCPDCNGKGYVVDNKSWWSWLVAKACDRCDGQGILERTIVITEYPHYIKV